MATGSPELTIPNYLRARTLRGLRRLMMRNNAKHGVYFPYFDIQRQEGYWYAFFYQSVEIAIEKEMMDGVTDGD